MSTLQPAAPVTVHICQGNSDALLIKSFLESRGIAVSFWGEALRTTHAFTMDGLGKVKIQVPATQEAEARDLLARMEQGEFALGDDIPVDE